MIYVAEDEGVPTQTIEARREAMLSYVAGSRSLDLGLDEYLRCRAKGFSRSAAYHQAFKIQKPSG